MPNTLVPLRLFAALGLALLGAARRMMLWRQGRAAKFDVHLVVARDTSTPVATLRPIKHVAGSAMAMLALFISGCSPVSLGFLNPAGVVANEQRTLFFWVVALSLVVVLPVIVLTPWLLWRYRYGQHTAAYQPRWDFSLPMEIFSWGVPLAVVSVLGVLTWVRSHQLDPYRPLSGTSAPLQVQVIALDWKWLFIYPQQGVASVNELVIPSGRAVHLSLTSATVMQSLFIPRLSGQMYAMAGMRTQQYLQADVITDSIGRNTQFNGEGFQAQMFNTRSVSAPSFDAWVADALRADTALNCKNYQQLSQSPSLSRVLHYSEVQAGLFEWVVHSAHASNPGDCEAHPQGAQHE